MFDSCMDEDKIENLGEEPLFDLIKEYGSWNVTDGNWTEDSWDFMDNFVKIQKYLSIAPLFNMYVSADLRDSTKNIIVVSDRLPLSSQGFSKILFKILFYFKILFEADDGKLLLIFLRL